MDETIHILQLGDTHWATSPIASGIDSLARFDQVCNWIGSIRDPIDWIVHTGDWVHQGHLATDLGDSTRAAWAQLSKLGIPIATAVGNHDHRMALSECFFNAWPQNRELHRLKTQSDRLAYWFPCKPDSNRDESLLVLDARGSTQLDPQGEICLDQLAELEALLADSNRYWTVFLHYPPIELDCDWINRTMLIRNGMRLHELFAKHACRIRGVFFGHIHRPLCCLKDGVLYASTGSAAMHFPNMPGDDKALPQNDPIAFANYISISQSGTLVKTQWTMLSR
jgi:3',5'-cyclic AMP phosphodiesterase CpdA